MCESPTHLKQLLPSFMSFCTEELQEFFFCDHLITILTTRPQKQPVMVITCQDEAQFSVQFSAE